MKNALVTFSGFDRNCPAACRRLEAAGFSIRFSQSCVPYFNLEQYRPVIGEVDALIAGLDTLDEAVFSLAPRLRIVARMGVGYDGVDLAAARRHNIAVTTTRGGNAVAVAEYALALLLAVLRDIPRLDGRLHQGEWLRYVGWELTGKTVGLVGFGDIGKRMARLLSGFGVRILACRRTNRPDPAAAALGVTMTDLPTLLRESDAVSLHLPGGKENGCLFDRAAFAAMKPGAVFVNTARGSLVDSAALREAVDSGHLFGAAVDVYAPEPVLPEDPVLHHPRILCTPHAASETAEAYARCGDMIARQILAVFSGRTPENCLTA